MFMHAGGTDVYVGSMPHPCVFVCSLPDVQ